jgi:uncharacterized protein (DUF2147 family)
MKKIFKTLFCLAAVSTALVSCNESYEPYEWGEQDVDGCYGVYFPAQKSELTLDPSDPTKATIAVARTVSDGAIEVPVVVADTSGIFTISSLAFEDGQSESSISLEFDNTVVGKTYYVSFKIEDPQYASKYSSNPIALDFRVTREKWNNLGQGTWYEDGYFTFTAPVPVTILQNDGDHNQYRVEMKNEDGNLYTDKQDTYFEFKLLQKGGTLADQKITTEGLVYFSIYDTGYYNSNYPSAPIWFVHPASFSSYATEDYWQYNKVVQYKEDKTPAAIQFAPYYYINGVGGWNYSQQDGVISLVFPGAVLVDYSIDITTGETADGVMPVALELGSDVANVKYVVYEGSLSATQVSNKASGIEKGTEENITEYKPVEGDNVIGVELAKTGVYTIVAVVYDAEGNAQGSGSAEFCYVAKGDSMAVEVSCGVAATDKYTPEGYTSENSLEYYVYGKDLTDVKIGIFTQVEMVDSASCAASLLKSKSVKSSILEEINDKGYVGIAKSLSPGTKYYMLVWASNGYESSVISASATTNGDPLPVYMNYNYNSYADEFAPGNKTALFGTYNLYAVDLFGKSGMREYIGKAVIADSETATEGPDDYGYYDEYFTIKGLGGAVCEKAGVDDTYEFDLYAGSSFYNASKTTVDGKTSVDVYASGNGKIYSSSYVTYGIPVAEGYYAIVSASYYADSYNFSGYCFYNKSVDANNYLCAYGDYLLVDPEKDNNGLAPKAVEAKVAKVSRTLKFAGDMGMSPKEAINAVLMDTPIFNSFVPAGIDAEWDGVSVKANTVSVDAANLQKVVKTKDFSNEPLVLR